MIRTWTGLLLLLVLHSAVSAEAPPTLSPSTPIKDPYKDQYLNYSAPFVQTINAEKEVRYGFYAQWKKTDEEMKLSSESSFYTLNLVEQSDRADALVEAGLKKERERQYREALKLYQMVIEKFSGSLYRVSTQGIFVPVGQYCQRRILNFPAEDLAFYRTLYDAKAKEAFEQARRKNSLSGLAEIVESQLATSFGDNALLELGNAAMDAGNFLEALEYLTTLRDFLPDSECRTSELDLKIAYCEKLLGDKARPPSSQARAQSSLSTEDQERLKKLLESASFDKPKFNSQQASAPNLACDDYTLWPPTQDPLALKEPVWVHALPGSRRDFVVYTQPLVTNSSLIYRHKNILYCHSLLTGELRWRNDLGGRATWQNMAERQFPQEDLLVQDGLVFTPLYKIGPSLVALDEVTGQLRWAHGPMAASTEEEAQLRFEAAPATGNRTVYAGYVLDNIEGETHTDTEYGLMAFENSTGRVRWRTPACRLTPGKFTAGFDLSRRNRIRSFTSPPLYHQGTVYYNTNAGAIVSLDGRSGRIKWLMRYPYYPTVHDATRPFGIEDPNKESIGKVRPPEPMLWLNQRPLVLGEQLYIAPVDSPFLFCINRRDGKVVWSRRKMSPGYCYFMGPMSTGELVLVLNGRNGPQFSSVNKSGPAIMLLDPLTGETIWSAPFDPIMKDEQPVMKHYWSGGGGAPYFAINTRWFENAARPFLSSDDNLYIPTWTDCSIWWRPGMQVFHLACISLKERKILQQRRYYTGETLAHAHFIIHGPGNICPAAPEQLAALEAAPFKNERDQPLIAMLKEIVADKVPENAHGPFLPFSRMTFNRFGVPFEMRISARTVELVYDRQAVRAAVEKREDPEALFARAELAVAESRLDEASALLNKCLAAASSEDLDFRALINQQLFQIHQRLAQRGIFKAAPEEELASCLGMTRTANTLSEELQTLFALAEANEHKGDLAAAARCLRNIIGTYGQHEYPVAGLSAADENLVLAKVESVLEREQARLHPQLYAREMGRNLNLIRKGFPLYFSTVSPLPKTLTVRAGELAAAKLARLQKASTEFAQAFEAAAEKELAGRPAEEQLYRLWEFPATRTAQKVLEQLFQSVAAARDEAGRKKLWSLADAARICALQVPESARTRNPAEGKLGALQSGMALPYRERAVECADAEGTSRLVLERRDEGQWHAQLLFLGGRTRKRSDNKFSLTCLDLESGKQRWEKNELRFLGNREKYTGDEGGFFEAFVHEDIVVVHGLYDVFAFGITDGEPRWRFKVPFNFEIKQALQSGDLLVLSGQSETLALYIPTASPSGEVAWQEKETGDLYIPPYFHGDRWVSLRKLPFNVTVRYRATGKLMGRLALPDLTLNEKHPLLPNGPEELPAAHDGSLLVVTDSWYYLAIDVTRMAVLWKRLIDHNDELREPALRLYLKGEHLVVVKENFDQKAIYLLSSQTGNLIWGTDPDPKKAGSVPSPLHSIVIDRDCLYGIQPHPVQGFYLVGLEAKTGKRLFSQAIEDYQGKPSVRLWPRVMGDQLVAEVQDNQNFELRAFATKDGKELQKVSKKGVGPMGVHGRVSATVQWGRLILLSKDKLSL